MGTNTKVVLSLNVRKTLSVIEYNALYLCSGDNLPQILQNEPSSASTLSGTLCVFSMVLLGNQFEIIPKFSLYLSHSFWTLLVFVNIKFEES